MMNKKEFGKAMRAEPKFVDLIKDVSIKRIKNGLEKDRIGTREMTRMMMNTASFNNLLFELETKPRRKE